MPELPEVETFTRYFERHALGQPIERVRVLDERVLGDIRKPAFVRAFPRHTFTRVHRHGKHFFADFGPRWLHLHFGMSGELFYYSAGDAQPRFARAIFDFKNGAHLAFDDMRIFGVVDLTPSPEEFVREHGLGPDPMDAAFRFRDFAAIAEDRRGAIKSLLMTQEVIAGIGNLYADEILFQTSIHPRRAVDRVKPAELRAVFTTMRRVLREAIARRARDAELPPKYLFNHREEGGPCPRCGGAIRRTVVFGRTTYFCSAHQR